MEFDEKHVYAIGMRTRFRGISVREGMLLRGPAGWGEFCPFTEYTDRESEPWLACAIEACRNGWPTPVRDWIPVNCTVPVVSPERAYHLVAESGCTTAKVKVADPHSSTMDDCGRIAAVRDALGPCGAIRVDANAAWDVDTAVSRLRELDRAAGGLEYAEQPCPTVDELAAVRRKINVRIAADESIRRAADPIRVAVAEAADVAVLKVAPLGGVRRTLQIAEACGLPCVVSSALETSVGLAAEVALAGCLPHLDFACGLATLSLLNHDVVAAPLHSRAGWVPVPRQAPEPTTELLAGCRAEPSTTDWWAARLARTTALTSTPEEHRDADQHHGDGC